MRMPALFVGHGSPMNAIEDNIFTRGWRALSEALPRPKAILSVSAHWYTNGTRVSNDLSPRTIHDMYGFPKALYEIRYDVSGAPEVAQMVMDKLTHPCRIDNSWGIDHGTWSVLHVMYPDREIPVLQLSVDGSAPAQVHLEIGRSLAALRENGVMIFGSGNVVHNLRRIRMDEPRGFDWAYAFDGWIKTHVLSRAFDKAADYYLAGDAAKLSVPTPDHFYPLLYVLGASHEMDQLEVHNEASVMGSISMTSYVFLDRK